MADDIIGTSGATFYDNQNQSELQPIGQTPTQDGTTGTNVDNPPGDTGVSAGQTTPNPLDPQQPNLDVTAGDQQPETVVGPSVGKIIEGAINDAEIRASEIIGAGFITADQSQRVGNEVTTGLNSSSKLSGAFIAETIQNAVYDVATNNSPLNQAFGIRDPIAASMVDCSVASLGNFTSPSTPSLGQTVLRDVDTPNH